MHQVFISYKREERHYLDQIRNLLEKEDLGYWFDTKIEPSDDWLKKIIDNLHNSYAIIVILSPLSAASHFVTFEWSWMWSTDKHTPPIIPVIFEGEMPNDSPLNRLNGISWDNPDDRKKLIHKLREMKKAEVPSFIKFWQKILDSSQPVTIALPLESADNFFKDRKEYTQILTVPEAFALSDLMQTFANLRHYDLIGGIPITLEGAKVQNHWHNLISLGGSISNPFTEYIWDSIKDRLPYESISDNKKHGYRHKNSGKELVTKPVEGRINMDRGLVIIAKNPMHDEKKVCLLIGCYAYGSLAAARILTREHVHKVLDVTENLDEFVYPVQVTVNIETHEIGTPKLADGFEVESF